MTVVSVILITVRMEIVVNWRARLSFKQDDWFGGRRICTVPNYYSQQGNIQLPPEEIISWNVQKILHFRVWRTFQPWRKMSLMQLLHYTVMPAIAQTNKDKLSPLAIWRDRALGLVINIRNVMSLSSLVLKCVDEGNEFLTCRQVITCSQSDEFLMWKTSFVIRGQNKPWKYHLVLDRCQTQFLALM